MLQAVLYSAVLKGWAAVAGLLWLQVCPVEGAWVQAMLPRLESVDVNRLR